MTFRTDRNNNPTAFTTAVAAEAGLILGQDYRVGDSFQVGDSIYYTATLLGDPIATTIRVIDKIGFYTSRGIQRWSYIGLRPQWVWTNLTDSEKKTIISFMYGQEGGIALKGLFTL